MVLDARQIGQLKLSRHHIAALLCYGLRRQ
jgi:hypothetical protein